MRLLTRVVVNAVALAAARELGCSVGSVKSQTHHALRRLRAALPDSEPLLKELS